MRSWFPTLLALALLRHSPARSASDRTALDRFRDSLAAVQDTAALRTLQQLPRPEAAARILRIPPAARSSRFAARSSARIPTPGDARGELRRWSSASPDWP